MTTHELKTWPWFFEATWDGRKDFEVRVDDRGFKSGDFLVLREYKGASDEYTGREMVARIVNVFGLPLAFGRDTVAMTIEVSDRVAV